MAIPNFMAGGGAIVIGSAMGLVGAIYGKRLDHGDTKLEVEQARMDAANRVVSEAKEAQLAATTAQLADTQGRYENLLAELGYWRGEVQPLRKDVAELTKQLAETRLQHATELAELRNAHASEIKRWEEDNRQLSREVSRLAVRLGEVEDQQEKEGHRT